MSDQPLLQFSTPIKPNEDPQVVLRLDTDEDVQRAIILINQATELLVPLTVGLVDVLERALQGEGLTVGKLQSAGLNPVPMAAPQAPAFVPQPQPIQAGPAQPVYQPQAQASQAYAPPVQQAAPQQAGQVPPGAIIMQGACWADTRHTADCKDCGGPTYMKVMSIRNGSQQLNVHQCAGSADHKVTWCMTPIWESRKATALGQGIQIQPGLIFG